MIEVRELRRRFGEVVAVDGVSFTAADGAITGLLGPNGAGKTTTMRMIGTLVRPDSGEVLIDGRVAADDPAAAKARLGVLPEAKGLYPRLTAREHLEYFGRLDGLYGRELSRRVEALLARLGLGALADRRAAAFSQGERMKVCVARALIHDPPNVMLDEPTNGLDVMTIRAIRALLGELRAEGRCIVFSSHVMQEVAALCDRLVIIAHGRVVAVGPPEEIRQRAGQASLEEAFVQLIGGEGELAS
ncbi:MAG: ABC transporter ATP-binding protein [Myxococcales bacterium]